MKIVILGASGDGAVVAQAIKDLSRVNSSYQLLGFLDDSPERGEMFCGVPVLGKTTSWRELEDDVLFLPALHKVKQMFNRKALIESFRIPDRRWATVIHPDTVIADDVKIGFGVFIASFVTIQPGTEIKNFVSIRAGANLGHDSTVSDYCYIGPNATLCGHSKMACGAHLGPNAVVTDGLILHEFSVASACSLVTKAVSAFDVVLGNPARKVSSIVSTKKAIP